MKKSPLYLPLLGAVLLLPLLILSAPAAIDYEGNLAKVPPADPEAADAPQLLPSVKGQHPRLLYSQAEIEALKAAIPTDPVLKRTYDDVLSWVKRMKPVPKEQITAIVHEDTPSLSTCMERFAALAYIYSLNHDPNVKALIVDILQQMVEQPYWADTAELDCNMGAANNMLMVAVLYDAVYNDLDPEFRTKVAQALLVHARRMYYLGHQQLSLMPVKYWQQDPQPNHRWYRNAGLAASLLVIADEPDMKTDFLRKKMKEEIDFVTKWYPADGDCHEGAGYQQFGFSSLVRTAQMMDRNLGTRYLELPGFREAWSQQLYFGAPGRMSNMSFGDDMNGNTPFNHLDSAFFIGPHLSRDKNVQAGLKHRLESRANNPTFPDRPFLYPWTLLAFYDPTVGEGDYKAIPTNRLFPDLGAVSLRDSWEDQAVALTFHCGPYGGYRLNDYRETTKDSKGQPHYINVAHDDPDANSFSLTMAGDFLFHPGLYSLHKITENQSTITVDGKGQVNEGDDFLQPVDGVDMRTLSYLTGWKTGENGRTIVEGEAGAAYIGMTAKELKILCEGQPTPAFPAPVLDRYRRTMVWMPGEYVLILDDIRGNGAHEITWRGTVEKGKFDEPDQGRCHAYTKSGATVDFQILANKDFTGALDYMFLDGRFGSRLMQQFQFSLKTEAIRFACILDPWKKKPSMSLSEKDGTITLKVHAATFDDVWTWEAAPDNRTPSHLVGTRQSLPLIALTDKDKAPLE